MFWSPHYFAPFDMEGHTGLLVEARLREDPADPFTFASLQVQGTHDRTAERKNWVSEGSEIPLSPGNWEQRVLRGVRQEVRVMAGPHPPGRFEVRLTRLP